MKDTENSLTRARTVIPSHVHPVGEHGDILREFFFEFGRWIWSSSVFAQGSTTLAQSPVQSIRPLNRIDVCRSVHQDDVFFMEVLCRQLRLGWIQNLVPMRPINCFAQIGALGCFGFPLQAERIIQVEKKGGFSLITTAPRRTSSATTLATFCHGSYRFVVDSAFRKRFRSSLPRPG